MGHAEPIKGTGELDAVIVDVPLIMRTQAETPEERLARLLGLCECFLRDQGVDVAAYLRRVETEGVGAVVSDVINDSQKRDVHLPPGYWQALFDLRDEVIPPLSDS